MTIFNIFLTGVRDILIYPLPVRWYTIPRILVVRNLSVD